MSHLTILQKQDQQGKKDVFNLYQPQKARPTLRGFIRHHYMEIVLLALLWLFFVLYVVFMFRSNH